MPRRGGTVAVEDPSPGTANTSPNHTASKKPASRSTANPKAASTSSKKSRKSTSRKSNSSRCGSERDEIKDLEDAEGSGPTMKQKKEAARRQAKAEQKCILLVANLDFAESLDELLEELTVLRLASRPQAQGERIMIGKFGTGDIEIEEGDSDDTTGGETKKSESHDPVRDGKAEALALVMLDRSMRTLASFTHIRHRHLIRPGVWDEDHELWFSWSHERQLHLPRREIVFRERAEYETLDFHGRRLVTFLWDVERNLKLFARAWCHQRFLDNQTSSTSDRVEFMKRLKSLSAALNSFDGAYNEPQGPALRHLDPVYHALCIPAKNPLATLVPVPISRKPPRPPSAKASPDSSHMDLIVSPADQTSASEQTSTRSSKRAATSDEADDMGTTNTSPSKRLKPMIGHEASLTSRTATGYLSEQSATTIEASAAPTNMTQREQKPGAVAANQDCTAHMTGLSYGQVEQVSARGLSSGTKRKELEAATAGFITMSIKDDGEQSTAEILEGYKFGALQQREGEEGGTVRSPGPMSRKDSANSTLVECTQFPTESVHLFSNFAARQGNTRSFFSGRE